MEDFDFPIVLGTGAPVQMSRTVHDVKRAFTLNSRWLASAILHGRKAFENRSQEWPAGWYAVHIGVSESGDAWAEQHVRDCCETDEDVAFVAADVADGLMPRGAIVGFCHFSHVLPPEACNGSPWALGPYCMVIDRTMFLDSPVENVRGQLGIWTIDAPLQCRLAHHATRNAVRVSTHARDFPPDPRALVRARARLLEEKRKRKRDKEEPQASAAKQCVLSFTSTGASLRSTGAAPAAAGADSSTSNGVHPDRQRDTAA